MNREATDSLDRIAVVGDYLPRQCGIATFTTDLCESLAGAFPSAKYFALPVNDTEEGYDYPDRVRFEIAQNDVASYRLAADFLNINDVDLVCLQHEYGIYGGPAGNYVLALLRDLRMPIVTTLHTVLREPDANQRATLAAIARLSDRLVVMSRRGAQLLQETGEVPPAKIDVIPHGIHDVPFVDPNYYKDRFGVEGRTVLLTFGLLSPNKGIETMIRSLPEILRTHPEIVYLVLGATHPHVRRRDGESYRLSLQRLAEELGVEESVIFHNRFVSLEELIEFIGAADLYVTPYLNAAQVVSGTLAYAVGAGKAVVSTPYWHAEELLADGRGCLVPFADSAAMARTIVDLLDNPTELHAIRKRAYQYGRDMVWPRVAQRYMESFERAREERRRRPRPSVARLHERRVRELPPLNLDHLRRLTDDVGILQHAVFAVPNYAEGYTTDDNARALALSVLLEQDGRVPPATSERLASRYMGYLWYAFDGQAGRFRNQMTYDRRWVESTASEDCHGRALVGLGTVVGRSGNEGLRGLAGRLFDMALPAALEFTSSRACAFALLGLHEYLKTFYGDRAAQNAGEALSERLMERYRASSGPGWPWFEPILTYSNASLPHALLVTAGRRSRDDMARVALETLAWLAEVQRVREGHFVPIGSNGWYPKGGTRARFDQQPIEARAMVSACLEAQRVTGDTRWRREAERAFEWFLGWNDLKVSLYDPSTGGCRDGLHPERRNQNQGAESTLSFLLALLEMRLAQAMLENVFFPKSHEHIPAP